MALVRVTIPDLVGGVSKQPDSLRFSNQCEEIDNCFLYLATGLEKRYGSTYVENITKPSGTLKIHWVERSPTQRYIFIFRQDSTDPLYIYKIDGTACSITYDAGTATALKTYLNTNPDNIRAVSFDDTTIVANTSITTAVENTTRTYTYNGTNVDNSANAHNKASWDGFNLPPTAVNEFWYARGDAAGWAAGWYKSISTSNQPWYERVVTPMSQSTYDPATMPIRITQTGDTTFTVSQIPWKGRLSGDGNTNPPATFVGKAVSDICLHRNRLWIAAGENIVGSQAGDYYNFWANSFTSVIDSDPIDLQLGSAQVSKVSHIVPYNKAIVVFTNGNQQFEIRAREALTPTTVAIIPSTAYSSPSKAKPIIVGSSLYWASNKGAFSQVYEYISDDAAVQSTATDVTSHVETYIIKDIAYISATSASDVLVMGDGISNAMYLCFMFWQGERKLQNSWCKFVPADDGSSGKVLSANIFGDTLYMVHDTDGCLRINKIIMRYVDSYPSYLPRIDSMRQETGTWTKGLQETEWLVDYNSQIDTIFLGSEWGAEEGVYLTPSSVTGDLAGGSIVKVSGKYDSYPVWIGCSFNANVELSRQFVRDREQVPIVGALQLKSANISHRNTGYFTFEVDPEISPAAIRVMTYTPKTVGSTFIASENALSDKDTDAFKVMGNSAGITMNIKSNHPSPMNITSIEFATNFVERKTTPADR